VPYAVAHGIQIQEQENLLSSAFCFRVLIILLIKFKFFYLNLIFFLVFSDILMW
jgi:hypothetical protein